MLASGRDDRMNRGGTDDETARRTLAHRVKSIFDRSATQNDEVRTATASVSSASSRKAARAVSGLKCVSESEGERAVAAAMNEVVAGNVTMAELATSFFDSDGIADVEAAPYLCNLAELISRGYVGVGDIDVSRLRDRAVYEVGANHAATCSCEPVTGVQKLFDAIVGTGRSRARDNILNEALCALLQQVRFIKVNPAQALTLVLPVINSVVRLLEKREQEHILAKWARTAVLQSTKGGLQFDEENDAQRCQVWTTELRDLATALKPIEHLLSAEVEEKALVTLFNRLAPNQLVDLVQEIISTVAGQPGVAPKHNLTGCFARICVLVRHTGGLEAPDERNESPVKSLERALASALCGLQGAHDRKRQAMCITLARFLFGARDVIASSHLGYEKWLLGVLKTANRPCIVQLLLVLNELVPLDPVPYLKAQTRCFRRVPAWVDVSRDYCAIARTRVKDLTPSDAVTNASNASVLAAKSMEDMCRYVAEFHRNDGKVPTSLVRFMNFHRYNFRENILPLLLQPDLDPPKEVIDADFALGGFDLFDEKRIELIKVLAYERMDKAVRKDEADNAVPKIEQHIRDRRAQLLVNGGSVQSTANRRKKLNEDSSLAEIFEEVCNSAMHSLAFEREKDAANVDSLGGIIDNPAGRWHRAKELLVKKLLSVDNVPECAVHLLQVIADQMQISVANAPTSNGIHCSPKDDISQYARLWRSCERWLRALMIHVLGKSDIKPLSTALKLQLVAAVCFQNTPLSMKQVTAIALLLYTITLVPVDSNAAYLMTNNGNLIHIVTTVAESLPLDSATVLRRSYLLAITYLGLVLANSEHPTINTFAEPAGEPCSTWQSDYQNSQSTVLPPSFTGIVRWVLCGTWRLNQNRGFEVAPPAEELLGLVKKGLAIANVLALRDCGRLTFEDWLRVELRAGWGREEKVPAVLKRFAKNDPEIIADAVMSVARLCADGRPLPSWVIHGIAEAANSSTARGVKQSLASYVNDCDVNFCKVFVRVAMRLPETTYFLNDNPIDVFRHIQASLCSLWPFDLPLLIHLLRSMSYCRKSERPELPPPMLVASVAAHCKAEGSDCALERALRDLDDSSWNELKESGLTFARVLMMLDGTGSMNSQVMTQVMTQLLGKKNRKHRPEVARRAVQKSPETLALSLVADNKDSIDFIQNIGESFETLVSVDVLDATIEAAALLCFPRALVDAVRARLLLVNAPLPWWLCGNEHTPLTPPFIVKRMREILHTQAKDGSSLIRVAAALADIGDKALGIAARQNALSMLVHTLDDIRRGLVNMEDADRVVCGVIEKVAALVNQRPSPDIMRLLKTYLPNVVVRATRH